jgi:hypothetical protein
MIKAMKDAVSQTDIQLVDMVPNCLVVTALLLHTITFLPNLFAKKLPITGSLATKVTGYRSWFHQLLLLLLSLSF